jgi:hypothetical protein
LAGKTKHKGSKRKPMTKKVLIMTLALGAIMTGCIHNDFDQPPAGGSDPDVDPSLIRTIEDIKALYNGGDAVEIEDSVFLAGIVTADDRSGNFYQTIVLEDESAGVSIRIGTTDYFNIYPVGRRVFVNLKGLFVGQYAELVQIGIQDIEESDGVERIPNFLVEERLLPGQFGLELAPTDVTINELASNRDAFQNRLIRLSDVEFSCDEAGQPYADAENQQSINRIVYNCSGNSIILRNSGFAEFASDLLPSGNGTLTAIFSVFADDDQLFIRETSDVQFTNERCVSSVVSGLVEDFESGQPFQPVSLNNWQTISVTGAEPWEIRTFGGNQYAQVQGFNSNSPEIETWLVSPRVDLDEAMTVSFDSKIGFWTHDGLEVFLSTNFDGCDISSASWIGLNAEIANAENSPDGVGGYANFFVNSGDIDISSYTGEGVIGFRYTGNNSDQTTTYQVDNVQIGTPPPPEPISIADVRASYSGSTTTAPNGIITGVVISDPDNMNFNSRNMVIQDATAGIVVRFTSDYSFGPGEEVSVNIAGLELSEFNGLLQVNNVPPGNATSLGAGTLPEPQVLTTAAINANEEEYESELVRINNVTLTADGANYPSNDNVTITDASGSIMAYIRSSASFSGLPLPAGEVDIISVVTVFGGPQIYIRSSDDVQ